MPVNAADPSYHSFIKNVLPLLVEKNMGVLAMKTLADRGFFGQNRWDARPTGVSPLIPNRISVTEAIHFVWSLPVSVLITGAESLDQLHEKIELANSFKGMSQEERQRIIALVRSRPKRSALLLGLSGSLASSQKIARCFPRRKDSLPVEPPPQADLSFLFLLGAPRFA